MLRQLPETPADILAAAVKAEVNECCVCLEALTSYVLLSCNVKTLYGPFHVMCECGVAEVSSDPLSSSWPAQALSRPLEQLKANGVRFHCSSS